MAAMQHHPPPPDAAAAGVDNCPPAAAYIRLIAQELWNCCHGRNAGDALRRLLRCRPLGVTFPASVTAALDDLEELYAEGSAPMAAYARHAIREKRAEHEERLRDAMSTRLSVARRIRDLGMELAATSSRLEEVRATVRRTLRRLPVAVTVSEEEEDGGDGAVETSASVVYLVELLGHGQGTEAALVAAMEAMEVDYDRLLRQRDAVEASELAEMTALEEIPQLTRATDEEDQLALEAAGRFRDDTTISTLFLVKNMSPIRTERGAQDPSPGWDSAPSKFVSTLFSMKNVNPTRMERGLGSQPKLGFRSIYVSTLFLMKNVSSIRIERAQDRRLSWDSGLPCSLRQIRNLDAAAIRASRKRSDAFGFCPFAPRSFSSTIAGHACGPLREPMAAATQDHRRPSSPATAAAAATPEVDHPQAAAYIRLVIEQLLSHDTASNTGHIRLLLRQRPHDVGAGFPAVVTAALDDLQALYSEGSAPMAALTRDVVRSKRAEHEERLRRAVALRLSVADPIRDLVAYIDATGKRLEEEKASIRRTLRLLSVVAMGGEEEDGGAVVSLVERLGHAQGTEAALTAAMEAMKAGHRRLLLQLEAAEVAEVTEMTALEDIPQMPRANEEDDRLLKEADGRLRSDLTIIGLQEINGYNAFQAP
uniref:Uncharacterized protein n=1 Tax=Oryza punctata TaxID=4537 RepID=A0A0E0MM99_ORYPU